MVWATEVRDNMAVLGRKLHFSLLYFSHTAMFSKCYITSIKRETSTYMLCRCITDPNHSKFPALPYMYFWERALVQPPNGHRSPLGQRSPVGAKSMSLISNALSELWTVTVCIIHCPNCADVLCANIKYHDRWQMIFQHDILHWWNWYFALMKFTVLFFFGIYFLQLLKCWRTKGTTGHWTCGPWESSYMSGGPMSLFPDW